MLIASHSVYFNLVLTLEENWLCFYKVLSYGMLIVCKKVCRYIIQMKYFFFFFYKCGINYLYHCYDVILGCCQMYLMFVFQMWLITLCIINHIYPIQILMSICGTYHIYLNYNFYRNVLGLIMTLVSIQIISSSTKTWS